MEEFSQVVSWLIQTSTALWSFLGTAGFLGFAVIGLVILKKVAQLFKKLLTI